MSSHRANTYSSSGVVLGKRNYGETDKIISVYSKDFGKIFLLAKATRTPKSRKTPSLEVFNLIRFQAVKSKGIDIVTEVSLLEGFNEIKADLKKTSVAYFLLEVVGKLTREEEKNENIFESLLETLNNLKSSTQTRKLKEKFIVSILTQLGFWPEGVPLINPQNLLEEVAERKFSSARVGKVVLENLS